MSGCPPVSLPERFLRHVERMPWSGCWIWMGSAHKSTNQYYGSFKLPTGKSGGKGCEAHRASYEIFHGPIPHGMWVDHTCRVGLCVNPDHLRVVTQQVSCRENNDSAASLHARQTHCVHGHEFSTENTAHWGGIRNCLTCSRARYKAWKQKRLTGGLL